MSFSGFIYRSACLAVAGAALLLASCRVKDKNNTTVTPVVADHGSLTVRVNNIVGGQPLTMGTIAYTNASGNVYSVHLLKYFVTNFTLIKNDNSERNFGTYKLINADDTSTCSFTLDSVTNGNYKAIRFYMGVDSAKNHTLLNEGDLNPSNGMVWTWSTGYIFFKHEGTFRNDTGGITNLVYHYGLDANRVTVDIPVTQFTISGDKKVMYLNFDLNTLYANPNHIDFSTDSYRQSTDVSDRVWLGAMKANFSQAFTFDKVQ